MADYDIFREQLAIKYPSYGHALWEPSPRKQDRPVRVGDVGFIRRGKFHRLFNAMLPEDDPSHERGVPEYHEPLVPTLLDHLDTGFLSRNNYCSAGVSVEADQDYHSFGPDDFRQVSFRYNRSRGAAVISLPVKARREDTLAQGDFRRWIVRHIDSWFAFAQKLGLGIEQMEEIVLVTGCHHTRSWTNIAFLGNQADAQVSFGVKVECADTSVNFQFSPENARGAVVSQGPEGTNLLENQCLFIRGFRVARTFWILGRRVKAAGGPSPDLDGYDCDPDTEVMSIPAIKFRDPLHLLLEYLAEQASDCEMVLAHDDDLVIVGGLDHDAPLESLEPEVMMDLLRRSNIEIDKVWCGASTTQDLSPTDSHPNTPSVVKVAMLSTTLQNWSHANPSQWTSFPSENIDLGHTNESRNASTSFLPGDLPISTNRGDTNECETSLLTDNSDSVPSKLQDSADSAFRVHGVLGHAIEDILLALGKIKNLPLNVLPSLSKFAHVERGGLLTIVAVTCCAVPLLGWVFSFTRDIIFKLFFTLLLASFPLSRWFEREYTYRRRLDERLEALQQHVLSLQLNLAVPTVVDVQYGFPIVARAVPANLGMLGQGSMEGIIQPAISEENTHDGSEKPRIDGDTEHCTRRSSPSIGSPIPMPFRRSPSLPRIEHTRSRTKSAPPRLSRVMSTPTTPTPTTPPSPLRADTCVPEPDEQWNADFCKRIERDFHHIVEDVRIVRDAILNSQPTKSNRGRAQREYDNTNNVRTYADLFGQLSEHKWTLNSVDSDSPDVIPQSYWFPASSIRDGERTSLISRGRGASRKGGIPSTSPQQLADNDRGFDKRSGIPQPHGVIGRDSDEKSDGRYKSGGRDDEMAEMDKLKKLLEREEEYGRRGDTNTRQSPLLLYSSNPSTKPSQRNTPSRRRQPPNFQPADYNADLDSCYSHPPPLLSRLTPDLSGISRVYPRTTGQISNQTQSKLASHGSVRSTGSASRGAGHHAAFLNSNQYRSASRERQTSTSANPHDRPLPLSGEPVRFPTFTSLGPRTSHGFLSFPENTKQDIPIPGKHTLPGDRPQGSSLGSLNSLRSLGDVNVHRRHHNEDHLQLLRVDEALSGASDDVVDQRHYLQRMHIMPSIRKMPSRQGTGSKQMDASSGTKEAQQFLEQFEFLEGVHQMDAPVNMPEDGKLDPIATVSRHGSHTWDHSYDVGA